MELTLLLSSITVVLLEAYKWLLGKLGKEATNVGLTLGAFVLAFVWVVAMKDNLISRVALDQFVSLVITAEGVYQLIVKNVKALVASGQVTPNP